MKRCIFVFVLTGVILSVFAQSQAVQDSTVRSQASAAGLFDLDRIEVAKGPPGSFFRPGDAFKFHCSTEKKTDKHGIVNPLEF
jgi:hypothetical protein